MNNLFISGMVSGKTTFREEAGGTPHMIFTIGVRAGKGYDYFRVSAWNRSALWAKEHITGGTLVAVHGRLHQHRYQQNGKDVFFVEIIADELMPLEKASKEVASQPIPEQQAEPAVQAESLSAATTEPAAGTAETEKEEAA